jgi:GntR family transcriptional regulator
VPRYHQIARALRERIAASALGPGERLDNQRNLAREFGVTLMTLRQALGLLERDGLIARRHGLGTFVARPAIDYDILQLRALAGDLSALGEDVATRFRGSRFAAADRRVAESLGLPERARVFVLERLRLVDGAPVSFQTSYLPAALGEEISKSDLAVTPLRQVLTHKLGIEITAARETVSAVALERRAARELGCRPGIAAFRSDRVSMGPDGAPVVYDRVFIPGDRFRITRHLRYDLNGPTAPANGGARPSRNGAAPSPTREAVRMSACAKEPDRNGSGTSTTREAVRMSAEGAKEPDRPTDGLPGSRTMKVAEGAREPDRNGSGTSTTREADRISAEGAKEPDRPTEILHVQPS